MVVGVRGALMAPVILQLGRKGNTGLVLSPVPSKVVLTVKGRVTRIRIVQVFYLHTGVTNHV